MNFPLSALIVVTAIASGCAPAQDGGELRVLSSNGVRVVLEEMQPRIEQSVGRRLAFAFSTSQTLTEGIEAGEAFDVAILTPGLIDRLISSQNVEPGSRNEFARVGIGVGSRQGTPAKSIDTLEDLRQVFLEAESVAYGANGQSRRSNEASFQTLDINAEMQSKARLTGPGEAPGLVAEGEIELVLTLVSELLREPGVQLLGPLPPEVQAYVHFEAAMSRSTGDPDTARALINFLST